MRLLCERTIIENNKRVKNMIYGNRNVGNCRRYVNLFVYFHCNCKI